eukprot:CAMPEP_0170387594 /NCGR_PEP_ID=MMETSP0117_2-20130122/17640_1 /TAXON_ID=400756 /ORGANISM="Durinskia baltica, Strain CSIRO CS-38" /LENGTH=179 /DNA_ID=CAMNT_0010643471 /DNA_START=38 /DNA_END=578 /DNA_ORIENTATION=+
MRTPRMDHGLPKARGEPTAQAMCPEVSKGTAFHEDDRGLDEARESATVPRASPLYVLQRVVLLNAHLVDVVGREAALPEARRAPVQAAVLAEHIPPSDLLPFRTVADAPRLISSPWTVWSAATAGGSAAGDTARRLDDLPTLSRSLRKYLSVMSSNLSHASEHFVSKNSVEQPFPLTCL